MDIGFIGLGNMGGPMARRLIEAGHKLIVYDTRNDAVAPLVALGAKLASSPADVADRVETVMASLPSVPISAKVATGEGGIIHGKRIKRYIDLSTTGSRAAAAGATKEVSLRGFGARAASRHRRGEGRALGVRYGICDRPQARHGADHEARQQFSVRHRDGGDLGSSGDGRQSRARSGGDDRCHQCRLRAQHRLNRQVSQYDTAANIQLRFWNRADA